MPPKPEDVEAFIADKSGADAYEKLVDRLLASPHYGERMAVDWLDAARYADTEGYHADNYRSVYPYRDYVINAFNTNMPFDRFTIEQLAGDLLPNATTDQKIASTYNRLNRTTEEGGAQAKEYLAKYAADRVRTTSTAWMGATLGCAECHDHKFDPYLTKDFYSFEAFFADIKEVGVGKPEAVTVPNDQQAAELKKMDAAIVEKQALLDTPTPELAAAPGHVGEENLADQPLPRLSEWHSVGPFKETNFESAFKKVFAPEKGMTNLNLTNTYQKGKLAWQAHQEWEDGKVYNGLTQEPGAAVYLYRTISADGPQSLTLYFGAGRRHQGVVQRQQVGFQFCHARRFGGPGQGDRSTEKGRQQVADQDRQQHWRVRFLFQTSGERAGKHSRQSCRSKESKRTDAQKKELAKYFRSITPLLDKARADVAAAKKSAGRLSTRSLPTTLVTVGRRRRARCGCFRAEIGCAMMGTS